MPRFVVLRHEMPGPQRAGVHWDLMLEQGAMLRTWALAEEPAAGRAIPAEALADHRTEYLSYEGPISCNRGSVRRWDDGEYESVSEAPDELIVRLRGRKLVGVVRLEAAQSQAEISAAQRWTFTFSPSV